MQLFLWIIPVILIAYLGYNAYKRFQLLKNYNPADDSAHIVTLTDANFKHNIAKGVMLVDFWASWCAPCKMIAPMMSELADGFKGTAKIGKLDVDANKRIASEFGIRSIPTLILFKNGKPVQTFTGIKPKSTLEKAIKAQL